MATKKDVAEWMYQELMRDGYLSQEHARSVISERFGRQFVKEERIAKGVLMEWRNLTRSQVTWHMEDWQWRLNKGVEKTG